MIQIAVMTFMYRSRIEKGELTHEQLADLCAAAGARGIEAFHLDFVRNPDLIPRFRRILADRNMSLPVMDVITNLAYATREEQQKGVDELRRGLDVCAELGTSIAHIAGCRPVEGVPLDVARGQIADALAAHVDMAAARGLTLAFEDFDPAPTLICSAKDCLAILERAGSAVKFVFDTGNFMACGERSDENLALLYDRTINFHFKDYALEGGDPLKRRGRPLGTGETPNPAVAAELVRRGYSGWVALESLAGLPPAEAIPPDMAVLKRWLQLA